MVIAHFLAICVPKHFEGKGIEDYKILSNILLMFHNYRYNIYHETKRSFSPHLVFINLFYQYQCRFSTNLLLSAYPLTIPFLLFFVRDILSWSFKTIKIRNIWKSLEISKAVVFFVFSRSHMEMVI